MRRFVVVVLMALKSGCGRDVEVVVVTAVLFGFEGMPSVALLPDPVRHCVPTTPLMVLNSI